MGPRTFELNNLPDLIGKEMLSIFAHIFLTSVSIVVSLETAPSFLKIPGNINAVEGGPVTMLWRHSQTESKACYWEFDDIDPVLRPKFVLYYNEAGGKSVGDHGIGWDFTNQENPCLGGITKARTTKGDAGSYKMGVGKIHSRKSMLHLYNVTNLMYSVRIVDMVYNGTAENTTAIVLPVKNLTDPDIFFPASVRINDRFPPNTNISVTLKNMKMTVDSFHCERKLQCETNLTSNGTSDSNSIGVLVAIDTGLWEYPNLVIEQSFVIPPNEHNGGLAAFIVLAVVVSILCVLSITTIHYLLLRRRNRLCSWGQNTPTPQIPLSLIRQSSAATFAELIPTNQGVDRSLLLKRQSPDDTSAEIIRTSQDVDGCPLLNRQSPNDTSTEIIPTNQGVDRSPLLKRQSPDDTSAEIIRTSQGVDGCPLLKRQSPNDTSTELIPTNQGVDRSPPLKRQRPNYTSAEIIQTYQGGESDIHYQEGSGLVPGASYFTPGAVAVCSRTQSILVTDINEGTVHVLNQNLQQESVFGGSGNGVGQYSQPLGIAVNSQGLVFVADRWNHRIHVVTRDGSVQIVLTPEQWNMQEFDPTDIAIDSTDNIYICDCRNKRIIILGADCAFTKSIQCTDNTQGLLQPEYIAVTKDQIAISDTIGYVYLLNHDGSHLRSISHKTRSRAASDAIGCDHCRGLVFDGQGYLVVTDSLSSGLLHIWKGKEGNTERACNGILTLPKAVGLTADGDLLVCDDTRLVKFRIPKVCDQDDREMAGLRL